MIRPLVVSALFLLPTCTAAVGYAQQMDCTVQVNYDAVPTANKDLLQNFERDIRDYIDNYTWGAENLPNKIRCTLNIFFKGATGDNKYTAQMFIGSQRPVFGSDKNRAVLRLFDETWEFTYINTQPLSHNLFQFDGLASCIDFYILLILGHDFDTFEPMGGTPYFRTAADIANLARSSGAKGWDVKAGSYSRLQLINEILSAKYEPVRRAMFTYHFVGLDSLSLNTRRSTGAILQALETIAKVRKRADPRNLYIKAFFDAKYMEIAEIFQTSPDRNVYDRLGVIDPAHRSTYDEAKSREK